MQDTLDPIQKTIEGVGNHLSFWRFVLHNCYAGVYCPQDISAKWTNYGSKHHIIAQTFDIESPTTPIPSTLYQSTVQLFFF